MDTTHDDCPGDCPMMTAALSTQAILSAQPDGQPCCEISAGGTSPSSQLQAPSAPSINAPQTDTTSALDALNPAPSKPPVINARSVESCSPQAVLCTFLI